VTENKRR